VFKELSNTTVWWDMIGNSHFFWNGTWHDYFVTFFDTQLQN